MDSTTQLFPYFQPIVDIANGRIVGYEALARQYDENRQVISAGPLFSDTHIDQQNLVELDRSVRWQALEKFAELNDKSYLTLNISPSWIKHVRKLSQLPTLTMLEQLNIDRQRIIIEITETQCDIDSLQEITRIYRKHGLKVAIDDFGSGFSQLERVMSIHPDIIKIDMRLFKQAAKGGIASDIVHLLSRLSKRTGCRIVCEGVETDEEFLFGLNCGAQFLQGFLFSKAQADFQDELKYQRHISSLRNKFFNRKTTEQNDKIQRINKIKDMILRLKEQLQDDFNLNELAQWNFEETGILRFYLCDNDGAQTSPNFNFAQDRWFTDPSKINYNWSWRSYFYHLRALEQADHQDLNRFVTSDRYKDFDTDATCKTLSIRLDMERILLVDIITD